MALTFEDFSVTVDDAVVDDLRTRLARTRWPDQIPGVGWDYGTDRAYLQELCEYWRDQFDWRAFEARCNAYPQVVTTIDGQRIHCVHARSPEPTARPLIVSHGWPGSVAEFFEIIGPLVDPASYGGDPADAFHVVVPSLPGYGFSGPTHERGWHGVRVAQAFGALMAGLGYERYYAQGGDWGSLVTTALGALFPEQVAAVHVNLLIATAPEGRDPTDGLTEADQARLADMQHFVAQETGYQAIQSTKPQTLAYGLTDSPAGLAGWIVEKFRTWSDCDGDVERSFTKDRLLDNISIYWITGTINSSTRMYYETIGGGGFASVPPVTVPFGHTVFRGEIYNAPRAWVEDRYDIVYWNAAERGGHFAAMEVPDLFVDEVRRCFRRTPLLG
ncbi:MAG TPA: epoxide hydrolase [Acidimicrobiia bacterium]|nr:epoxide hydrolase [Acidimicrobiia bacterium]